MKRKRYLTASIVLTPRLREALDRAAREEQRSRSAQLRVLLERALTSRGQIKEPAAEK